MDTTQQQRLDHPLRDPGLHEILGLVLIVVGCLAVVAAAALVATALAVLVAGVFTMVFGIVVVYVASSVDAARKAAAPPAGERRA